MRFQRLATASRSNTKSRGWLGPCGISFAVAVTAIFGDAFKRVMSPTEALISLYAISAFILMLMMITGRRNPYAKLPAISWLASALVITYTLNFATGFDVELLPALMLLFYMSIPLAFLVVIPTRFAHFDLHALALFTTLLMVPIHCVGLIQQFVDTNFMVSTAYSEAGGVIARNFLDGSGSFNRLPSLFASADRYAGVSAMQFALSFLLLAKTGKRSRFLLTLVLFSLICATAGLMLAGARSRILIVGVAAFVGVIALLIGVSRKQLSMQGRASLFRALFIAGILIGGGLMLRQVQDSISELPVLSMLTQTADTGDAQGRFQQGLDFSLMPDNVSLFGEGLGTSADGRPGEFGIRAMWIEGGVFWTTIMLTIHACILFSFLLGIVRATLAGKALLSLLLTQSGLFWLFGLLAGLSSSFELSLALLLFPAIAIISGVPSARNIAILRQGRYRLQSRGMG